MIELQIIFLSKVNLRDCVCIVRIYIQLYKSPSIHINGCVLYNGVVNLHVLLDIKLVYVSPTTESLMQCK